MKTTVTINKEIEMSHADFEKKLGINNITEVKLATFVTVPYEGKGESNSIVTIKIKETKEVNE